LKASLKAPGFKPCAYEVKNRFRNLLFKFNLYRYTKALHFALSARHDLAAASRLLSSAARQLDARLECFEDAPVAMGVVACVAAGVAALALAVVKGRSVLLPWYNIRVAKQF
jgi:hypothetical protein